MSATTYTLVNLHNDPIGVEPFTDKDEAEEAARAEWAKGYEIYILVGKKVS